MQHFCTRRAENFRKLCNSFARVARKICVIPRFSTLDVCFCSDLNAILTRLTLSDVVRYAQLTIDECMQFFCARGVTAGFLEILQFFARPNLRDLDAGLAHHLALDRTSTLKRAATKFCSSCNHAGRIHATFLRAGLCLTQHGWLEL